MTAATAIARPAISGFFFEQIRNAAVLLFAACSFVVFIEPAPVDLVFFVVLALYLRSGLKLSPAVAPLLLCLVLYNLGGFISAIPVVSKEKTMMFVFTSTYMALSAIFIAYFVCADPERRFALLRTGLIIGGLFAAFFALLDYTQIGNLFPNTHIPGRATGTFKDPNVFSTFVILPGMMLMHGLMTGRAKYRFWSLLGLGLITAGVFLSFSRGAWINYMSAALLMALLTFVLTPRGSTRLRVSIFAIAAVIAGTIAFSILMSIESIRSTFLERFSLLQSYDAGETGRFGNQLNSIPVLMTLPLGFGPHQFGAIYGLDPHNTFINAFAAYGWLGGISYITMIILTIGAGLYTILQPTRWQHAAICVFCPLVTTIMQGVQIDTDHWRHLYWLLGIMWGLFAATVENTRLPRQPIERGAGSLATAP